ncbi:mannose-1-phosphate guanylyltransferase/mannose-6-phosphate isomerase [Sphingomonas flavalba]|uniref:mannose-1-phosphate guanylyltransferase/mannose-6-phosphate isomerase n=1 Tax=Sphingomonas flavalba TaxID=2559804 RepID=UPI00109D8E8D|nr:mannose-1-phosphate guanylyltransferase/mannose-6-phosphate isomerase [Sphingomonas flavalba]
MTLPITPVILSGGAGTRLWPMSRAERPKQLMALTAAQTMLQLTALRTGDAARFARPIVVANRAHADMVEQQLEQVGISPALLILEPAGRDTAPAIALAALAATDPETPLLVMPSDHVIDDLPAFHAAIARALPYVADRWLVTFGIAADAPETGYGYIAVGDALGDGIHRVARFVEKPDRAAAEAMLAAGGHAWNGGIFLLRADAYLDALAAHAPEILTAARSAMAWGEQAGGRIHPDGEAFMASPARSIDYAVMERAERIAVVPVAMGWSDVGCWDALHAMVPHDGDGNAMGGDVLAIDTRNCLLRSDGPTIAAIGVSDLIVVASGNHVLVLPRGRSQEVKRIVEALKATRP